jgi:hypothetical protein
MAWLEMINIRTAGPLEAAKVLELCRQRFHSLAVEKLLKVTVYWNVKYTTDISIHLRWTSDPGPGKVLGNLMSSELEDLGLINHSLWVEQEELITGDAAKIR